MNKRMSLQQQRAMIAESRRVNAMIELGEELARDSTYYPVNIPSGKKGAWSVSTFSITGPVHIANLRHIVNGMPEMCVSPGTYTRLVGPMGIMMSNTQLEYRTNREFIESARGHVLISGLGIGMLLRPLAEKKSVTTITVLELEQDVIDLVAPSYADIEKLRIIRADAFTWGPDMRFAWAMHDIWPDISDANLKQMDQLEKKYASVCLHQVCWSHAMRQRRADEVKALKERVRA